MPFHAAPVGFGMNKWLEHQLWATALHKGRRPSAVIVMEYHLSIQKTLLEPILRNKILICNIFCAS